MKNIFLIFIFIICVYLPQKIYSTDVPVRLCLNLKGDEYEKCLKSIGNELKNTILKQLNIASIDPIQISSFSNKKVLDDASEFSYTIKNATIRGFKNLNFKSLDFNPKNLTALIGMSVPLLDFSSNFAVKGIFQTLPLDLGGDFKAQVKNVNVNFEVHLKPSEHEAKHYTFDNVKVQSDVGDCIINLTSDNAKKQLVASYVEMQFNNNSKKIIKNNGQLINEVLKNIFEKIMRPLLEDIPSEKLFGSQK